MRGLEGVLGHAHQVRAALVPRVDSAPTTGWVPHPGASPMATGTMNTPMSSHTTKMAAPL